jgi:hypothetical protein
MRRMGIFCALLIAVLAGCGGEVAGSGSPPSGGAAADSLSAQSTPGASATPHATSIPTARPHTPTQVSLNALIPPGGQLPDDATCAASVHHTSWEPRPDNDKANHTNVYASGAWRPHPLSDEPSQAYAGARTTGNFTGTTDEILQWAACKWGFPVDTVRAQAVKESYWHQSNLGDCGNTTQPATHGCSSVGILQVRGADIPPTHPGTWPFAYQSTAWNADYTLGMRRACYEGKTTWLTQFNSSYKAGDMWGCIGLWFSGRFHDAPADGYIAAVQQIYRDRTWTKVSF